MKKRAPYGRIKETAIGGFCMSKEFGYIKRYEKEILELKSKGLTHREIAEQLGFQKMQIKEFFHRYYRNQRKSTASISFKRKGKPPKDYVVTEDMKIQELKYIIARKDSKIKTLEMENELMRDFLSLTERK